MKNHGLMVSRVKRDGTIAHEDHSDTPYRRVCVSETEAFDPTEFSEAFVSMTLLDKSGAVRKVMPVLKIYNDEGHNLYEALVNSKWEQV